MPMAARVKDSAVSVPAKAHPGSSWPKRIGYVQCLRVRHEGLWMPTPALPVAASHPFYQRLNQILDEKKFDNMLKRSAGGFTQAKWAGGCDVLAI